MAILQPPAATKLKKVLQMLKGIIIFSTILNVEVQGIIVFTILVIFVGIILQDMILVGQIQCFEEKL